MAEFFSTNLKYLREIRGLSQNKLAEKIGVNQTTIARWEDDNRVPTIDNAVDVANALNISIIDLLGKDLRSENQKIPPKNQKQVTISDEELERRLKELNEKEGVKIIFDKEGELTEEELNQIVSHAMFVKEQHYKNKNKIINKKVDK